MKQSMGLFCGVVLFFVFTTTVFATTNPTMFQNDKPFEPYDAMGILRIGREEYAPLEFFCGFENVGVKRDRGAFCLFEKKSGRFFSFSPQAENRLLTEENKLIELPVPQENGTVYLPLDRTAELLGLGVEHLSVSPEEPVRLTDENARLPFRVLWEAYTHWTDRSAS